MVASKPAAQPAQQVVTTGMPATEPYRVGDSGAPVSSVGGLRRQGDPNPTKVATEADAPAASSQSNDKIADDPPRRLTGQSLSRLAEKHSVSQARLVEINGSSHRDIQIGQIASIPQR